MGTALRVTSAILFFVGAHLVVPRVTTATANQDRVIQNNANSRIIFRDLITTDVDLSASKSNKSQLDSGNGYEPPNYGGPDSEHGSGTR